MSIKKAAFIIRYDSLQNLRECSQPSQMNFKLFMGLTAMSFLWVGSQIPLYLFGSVLPRIYQDIGGVDRYTW
jgi:hypothetical protein